MIVARVTKGLEVVEALASTPTTLGADGGQSKPTTPPIIKKISVRLWLAAGGFQLRR